MSTMQKSSLDWQSFKAENKLEDELSTQIKQGSYLEKQAFLGRADVRQFEKEKSVRDRERWQKMKK